MKILLFISLFFSLYARENPFFPYQNQKDLILTNNNTEKFTPLQQASILLPNSARVLKKVIIEIQNLDGSISKRELVLNQGIDWHLPIFISQNYNTAVNNTKKAIVEKKIKKDKKSVKSNKNVKKIKKEISPVNQFQLLCKYRFIHFYYKENELLIDTEDTLIRDFLLPNPHRIVLDFKKKAFFSTYKKRLNKKFFKSIVIGNHKGYYRVVLTLDGKYTYTIQKNKYNTKIVLH